MPKTVNGYPVDTNASDCMDSARLAGMMAMCRMESAPDCSDYLDYEGLGRRHPNPPIEEFKSFGTQYFSRDQMICLAAGLKAQGIRPVGMYEYVIEHGNTAQNHIEDDGSEKRFGGDYCLPHVVGALAIAAGVQDRLTFIQRCFLFADVIANALFSPMREQNQIIALCYITGFLGLYKRLTPKYKDANLKYWYDTSPMAYNRGELDVANNINAFIDGSTNN